MTFWNEPKSAPERPPLCGATLTPGHIAMERAGDAAERLDEYLDAMKRSGVLRTIFTTLRVSVRRASKRF